MMMSHRLWKVVSLLFNIHGKKQNHAIRNVRVVITPNRKYWKMQKKLESRAHSGGSVNKTILKPRLVLANTYTWDFTDVKFRVAAQVAGSLGKAAKFRSLYDIGESNPVPASELWSGSGSKVNQFVHVPTSVDTQHFIQIHARVFD